MTWLLIRFLVVYLLVTGLESALSSLRARYQTTDKAPDVASLINITINTPLLENCLISCSNNEKCKAVVFENGSCQLYYSAVGTGELSAKQIAVYETWKTSEYDSFLWKKPIIRADYSGCTYSTAYQNDTCDKLYDGDLSTKWLTPNNDMGQWVKLNFTKLQTVCGVDVLSHAKMDGQCSELTFTFDSGVEVKKSRECIEEDGSPIWDHFEFDIVNTTSLIMTCTKDCALGWKVFYEMIVYIL